MLSWPSLYISVFEYQWRTQLLLQRRKMFKISSNTGTKQVRGWSTDLLMGGEGQNPELSVSVIYSCHQCKA